MIYLNLGSNLPSCYGGRRANIKKSVKFLKELKIKLIDISDFYETPYYPDKTKPKFIHLCSKIETNLRPNI